MEQDKRPKVNHMEYMEGMERIESDIMDKVISARNSYQAESYTAADVRRALQKEQLDIEDFAALLSPAAEPFIEEMAQKAKQETAKHFGNSVYMFTPIYISNYCENYCVYCGFNCHNKIHRMKLNTKEIEKEMSAIAKTGLEEILILTGESRAQSDVSYIGEACKIARKYFKMVGIEVYPMNSEEYAYLQKCGADYVTVFQENEDTYYIDGSDLEKGDVINKPDSGETMTLEQTASLQGVYNINKGYAVFRKIEILFQNEEYTIVNTGTSYGLSLYDHIALDASAVKENQIVQ